MFQNIGELVLVFWQTLQALPLAWRHARSLRPVLRDRHASLLMVCILRFSSAASTRCRPDRCWSNAAGSAVGGVVGISVCRELAPVMMSILIAGRIGSAMARS